MKDPSDFAANAANAFEQLMEGRNTVPTSVATVAGKNNTQYYPGPLKSVVPSSNFSDDKLWLLASGVYGGGAK